VAAVFHKPRSWYRRRRKLRLRWGSREFLRQGVVNTKLLCVANLATDDAIACCRPQRTLSASTILHSIYNHVWLQTAFLKLWENCVFRRDVRDLPEQRQVVFCDVSSLRVIDIGPTPPFSSQRQTAWPHWREDRRAAKCLRDIPTSSRDARRTRVNSHPKQSRRLMTPAASEAARRTRRFVLIAKFSFGTQWFSALSMELLLFSHAFKRRGFYRTNSGSCRQKPTITKCL